MDRKIGYARTSTEEQSAGLEDQICELGQFGCDYIYREQMSGAKAARPELQKALVDCQPGDALVVTKPDRLARNTLDLLTIQRDLSDRGVGLVVLSMGGGRVDTRDATGKMMFTMFAAFATFERDLMLERQEAGIAKAKKENKYKGRPSHHAAAIFDLRFNHGLEVKDIAARLGITQRWVWGVLSNPRHVATFRATGSGENCAA